MTHKNMFVDRVQVKAVAGRGGNGASHFLRAKYVPLGGPDGGDGGRGGSVIFEAAQGLKTLIDFTYRREYTAEVGQPGERCNRYGKQGKDYLVKIPLGTMVLTLDGQLVADMSEHGQQVVIAKGGRGGRGNVHFVTSLRQAPRLAEKGELGEEQEVVLELKLIADVGLIGLPNAGKSSLLAAASAARPKIADYPFTTLIPNLGQVKIDIGASFVLVDIPGLIEGAAQGAGLGYEFLRHVERTRVLIHVIDVGFPGTDPRAAYQTVNQELHNYNPGLAKRPQLVALNKLDLVSEKQELEAWVSELKHNGVEVFEVSAATRQGVPELMERAYALLQSLPEDPLLALVPEKIVTGPLPRFELEELRPRTWRLSGKEVEKWSAMTDFSSDEAVAKFKHILGRIGITAEMKAQQVKPGDTVIIGKDEFLYQEDWW